MFGKKTTPDQLARATALILAGQSREQDEPLGKTIDRAERSMHRIKPWILNGADPVPRRRTAPVQRQILPRPGSKLRAVNMRDD